MALRSVTLAAAVIALTLAPDLSARQSAPSSSIVGEWTLNKELSDPPPSRPERAQGRGRFGGDGAGRGRAGGGGFGRGGFGRGGSDGGPGARGNPEDMQRRAEAVRDITSVPDRIIIVETESMVIITTGDGRTTRLAPDGSKVKDESTGIERKTHWDGGRLVSEISGAGGAKFTETYAVDPDSHRLTVSVEADGGRGRESVTRRRVYDRARS